MGEERNPIEERGEAREDLAARFAAVDSGGYCLTAGFRTLVRVRPEHAGQTLQVALEITLANGAHRKVRLSSTKVIVRQSRAQWDIPVRASDGPLVAICLASYNPTPAAFLRQIDSIIGQTHRNWVCIVCDDVSVPERRAEIEAVCRRDPRLKVVANDEHVGFYCNFERALRHVPVETDFVALADQDDYWYPDKLARCLSAFDPGIELVYSDMRIVRPDGHVAAQSYWTNRKNNYRDLDVVLVANTITGAASVFRAGLLDSILPFPERIGDAFHDHWIGSVALMKGQVAYIDTRLYDYVQHGTSVIGHYDFGRIGWKQRLGRLFRAATARAVAIDLKARMLKVRRVLLGLYDYEYRRLQLMTATLRLRFPQRSSEQERILGIFSGPRHSITALLRLHVKVWRRGETTEDAELRMVGGCLAHLLNRHYLRLFGARVMRRLGKVHG
jgi:glycosyltransferase involved in cell wall biosynthesis